MQQMTSASLTAVVRLYLAKLNPLANYSLPTAQRLDSSHIVLVTLIITLEHSACTHDTDLTITLKTLINNTQHTD